MGEASLPPEETLIILALDWTNELSRIMMDKQYDKHKYFKNIPTTFESKNISNDLY